MKHIPPFGAGPEDIYVDRNLETGTPGSKVPAAFFNIVLAELLNLLVAAGIEPSDEDFTQIEQAVRALANFNITGLTEQAAIDLLTDFIPFFDADAVDAENGDERKIKAGDLLSRFMGGRMTIAADANWNTLVTPGMYNTTGNTYVNGPLGVSAHPGTLWIIGRSQSANHATQLFFYSAASPAFWSRTTTDGGANWSAWREIGEQPAGAILGYAYQTNKTYSTITATIPSDDTPPQNTEGTEIFNVPYTAKRAGSKIRITAYMAATRASTSQPVTLALFKDAEVSAIASSWDESQAASTSNAGTQVLLVHEFDAVDTAEHFFKIRVGAASGNLFINGNNTARKYGGTLNGCFFILEEIKQ